MTMQTILDNLNPEQKKAVEKTVGPMLIVAGAGTGKTRTLTTKIAKIISDGTPPWRILAVTFTNKASGEMRSRIEQMMPKTSSKVWVHTFHSFCNRILRQHTKLANLVANFLIYDEKDQKKIILEVLKELGEKEKTNADLYLNIIARAKDELLDAGSYKIHAHATNRDYRIKAAQIYELYQNRLDKAGALDFGDLLLKTAKLLIHNRDIRNYYQDYFGYILVDEYQDTNHAQYVITKILSSKHKNLTVVGDPDQSIYSWRGADIRNILEFEHDFPDAEVVVLEKNYRSTESILKCAGSLIEKNINRKPKKLIATGSSGDPVCVYECASELAEAKQTLDTIGRLVEDYGYSLNDIAIFYRTNAQSRVFEDILRRHKIPYRIIGSVHFYERKEIKDALSYLRLLVNADDEVSLKRIINIPKRGIGKSSLEKVVNLARYRSISLYQAICLCDKISLPQAVKKSMLKFYRTLEDLKSKISKFSPSFILETILTTSGYLEEIQSGTDKDLQNLSRLNNLQELINALKEYEERTEKYKGNATISGFLQETALVTSDDIYDENQSALTLMTTHLAKGLEFDAVFLTGLEEGLFPIGAGQATNEELEEERRLCYVGMTRAKKHLFMTYAAKRRIFGRLHSNLPSRFLFESGLLDTNDVCTQAVAEHVFAKKIYAGQRVRHDIYGNGKIVHTSGTGERTKIKVVFDRGGMQTFMLRYSPIEFI